MDSFLTHFTGKNPAELCWLGELYRCVEATSSPRGGRLPQLSVEELGLAVLRCLQDLMGCQVPLLPLSYRFVSVSELVTRQNVPCCSHLTWSTTQYRQWAKEAEQLLPNRKALQRANLLLIGYLTDRVYSGQSTSACDGLWRVEDNNWSIRCKILNPSSDWLHKFMLFPNWNYISQSASGHGQQTEGYLELTGSVLPLSPDLGGCCPGMGHTDVLGAGVVARILQQRGRQSGVRLCVCGQVCALCPLLNIAGKAFFCFSLREGDSIVPILVSDVGHLCWQQCLAIGDSVCITELRVCALRALEGHKLLCVTPQSRLTSPRPRLHSPSSGPDQEQVETQDSEELKGNTQIKMCTDRENLPQGLPAAGTKVSKVISYKGVVTRLLDVQAGLFELDRTVGLCLAYQPPQDLGAGLRPGVEVEIHDVHFLYRPSPYAPDVLLCLCLRSNLRVTGFSPLEPDEEPHSSPSPAIAILLEKNLGVPQYLWLCRCLTVLEHRLCPRWVRRERLGGVASRLLECVLPLELEGAREKRNIFREMLEEPHYCPLVEYSVNVPEHELLSVRDVTLWMETECWTSLDLPTLLPPSAPHLTRSQLNPLLSWSVHSVAAWTQPRPMVVVGVLRTCEGGVCMQLTDQTGSVDCIAVERCNEQTYCAVSNTAWQGCLVCVQRFILVAERFLKTDFPSWAQLDQNNYIRHRHCRVYLQFCVDNLQVLSPSVSMATFLRAQQDHGVQEGWPRGGDDTRGSNEDKPVASRDQPGPSGTVGGSDTDLRGRDCIRILSGEDEAPRSKRVKEAEETSSLECSERPIGAREPGERGPPQTEFSGARARCGSRPDSPDDHVSVVFRVDVKQGLGFQSVHTTLEAPGRSLCFEVSATLFGEPQWWGQNPRNRPLEPKETEGTGASRIDLQFVGHSVHWFPLLQAGCVYRLVAPHIQNPTVLRGSCIAVKSGILLHGAPCLLVQASWRFYSLPPSLRSAPLPQVSCSQSQAVLSVSEVLCCSPAPDLVSFEGWIIHRITLEASGNISSAQALHGEQGMEAEVSLNTRLTVQDVKLSGQSVQVYLDFSQRPYITGLLPGARVLFQHFQRKVSQSNNVYCRSVALSCVTVNTLGQTHLECGSLTPHLPVPEVLLGDWVLGGAQRCILGRVRVHVACVLNLQMQWVCSLCGSSFKQNSCSRNHPPCSSTTAVFQAEAKVAVEDGTGEAHVWFPSEMISALLELTSLEWEGLQRLMRVRGHIRIYSRGRNLESDVSSEDPLEQYLSYLCVSTAVCRPLVLTCQLQKHQQSGTDMRHETAELKRFPRGDREFVTRMSRPLQLSCKELSQWELFV